MRLNRCNRSVLKKRSVILMHSLATPRKTPLGCLKNLNPRQLILTNPHTPSMYRANGAVRNVPEFYEAFDVGEGDVLYLTPEERVKIW